MDTLILVDTLVRVDTVRVVDTVYSGGITHAAEKAMEAITDTLALLVPLSAILLPLLILGLVFWFILKRARERNQLVVEVLEKNPKVDVELIRELMEKRPGTAKLVWGIIFLAIGVAMLASGSWGPGAGFSVLGLGLGLVWFLVDRRRR